MKRNILFPILCAVCLCHAPLPTTDVETGAQKTLAELFAEFDAKKSATHPAIFTARRMNALNIEPIRDQIKPPETSNHRESVITVTFEELQDMIESGTLANARYKIQYGTKHSADTHGAQ